MAEQSTDTFTLAQLTDVHLGPLPPFLPQHWNLKRLFGFINFRRKRHAFDDPTLVNELVADLKTQRLDHVAVTGDLANIGLPAEFIQSHAWLESVGRPSDVTVIPGNHDVYTRLWSDPGIERWRAYMVARAAEDAVPGLAPPLDSGFPFVRTFGRFALIALNSAVYMPPAIPAGRVGEEQTDRFVEISRQLHADGYVRIVLIHHPPLKAHGTTRCLRDAAAFEAALLEVGAELVIHGHNHRDMIAWRDTATGPLPIIGAAAAGEGGYNIYTLRRAEDGTCQIAYVMRRASGAGQPFVDVGHKVLDSAPDKREQVL
ncbi:MAG: metallophosphoesterase family protein [Hyphomicrobiaceae bacterium]